MISRRTIWPALCADQQYGQRCQRPSNVSTHQVDYDAVAAEYDKRWETSRYDGVLAVLYYDFTGLLIQLGVLRGKPARPDAGSAPGLSA
jgi:hypothetical protein